MTGPQICPGCGHPGAADGPVHNYMSASARCWARYGDILAREYSDTDYWRAHRLLTDAYCGHHSVGEDRRARQSLYIHLGALWLHYERRTPEQDIVSFLRRGAKSGHDFPHLEMPAASHAVRIDAIHAASDAAEHGAAVQNYARAVFDAWSPHHAVFANFVAEIGA